MRFSALILLLIATFAFSDTQKIVVDLTTGDIETFKTRLLSGLPGTIKYFTDRGDRVDAAVVIHGDAYKYFVENLENTKFWADEQLANAQEELRKKLTDMRKTYGITFEMCQTGMSKRGILSADIYKFVIPIKSATAGLVAWQNKGHAYIPIR